MTDEYPEELKDLALAALTVASLRHTKFDPVTAASLDQMKINILNQAKASQPQVNQEAVRLQDNWPPEIPRIPNLYGLIGRCSETFKKQLTQSDVRLSQGRLSIHKADVNRCILPLLNVEDSLSAGIKVTVYDHEGKEYDMTLKHWNKKLYVLITGWKNFFLNHNLSGNQELVIWMFRNKLTGKLSSVISINTP